MELRQLRYLCTIGEVEHFGRAAKILNVAQPALSRQIHRLEQELGVELFDRSSRGVKLTDAGRVAVADAKRILGEISDLVYRAHATGRGEIGRLRVGINESASSNGTMVNALISFRSSFPKVTLELQHMTSLQQVEALENGTIDVGFVYHFPEERTDISHIRAEQTAIVLALPKGHRLAAAKTIRLKDLEGEPMVWIRRATAPATYDRIMHECLRGGLSPTIAQEATSEPVGLSLVCVGGLLLFLTDTNEARCPSNVVLREVQDFKVHFRLDVVWRKADHSPLLAQFLEVVQATRSKMEDQLVA